MRNRIIVLCFVLVLIVSVDGYGDEGVDDFKVSFGPIVSFDDDEFWDGRDFWEEEFWEDFKFEVKPPKIEYPTIELIGGMTAPEIHKSVFDSKFTRTPAVVFKLGDSEKSKKKDYDYLVKYSSDFLILGYGETGWLDIEKTKEGEWRSKWWQFGYQWAEGLGYDFGAGFQLIFCNGNLLNWTHLSLSKGVPPVTPHDTNEINIVGQWDGSVRFGNSFSGGIKLFVFDNVGLNAGFERTIVYPRHLFWYWSGSMLIELASQGFVDSFVKRVSKSSPAVAPIVAFILKNGLSYGIYELRKKNMNWPFDTTAPFVIDNYQLGLSLLF